MVVYTCVSDWLESCNTNKTINDLKITKVKSIELKTKRQLLKKIREIKSLFENNQSKGNYNKLASCFVINKGITFADIAIADIL
tara:strand:- start:2767 stop:3018 length:252 start_codon:yes stop_codon:yes gene_type:complete